MRQLRWILQAPILFLTLGNGPWLQAAPGQTKWELSNFTWVHRVPAEPGAPANAQPAALSADAIQAMLVSVQAVVDKETVPLFAKEEAKALAKVFTEAFGLAQPGEDLILLSTSKRGGGFMEIAVGITARLFIRDGALNLIVHDARLPFMERYGADRTLPTFVYGSRKAASPENLRAPGASRLRGDWLAFPLGAVPMSVATGPVAVMPVVIAAPAAPAAPVPATRDAAFYEAQTQRLKALKRLREENLLSEAEYQEKREAILKTL